MCTRQIKTDLHNKQILKSINITKLKKYILRVTASKAHPDPVAPPPTTKTSNSSVFRSVESCSSLVGRASLNGTFSSPCASTYASRA